MDSSAITAVTLGRRSPGAQIELKMWFVFQVVLCFSPVGSTLRQRSRKFPAIINCTAINYFNEWPRSALESVAKKFLTKDAALSVGFTTEMPVKAQFTAI